MTIPSLVPAILCGGFGEEGRLPVGISAFHKIISGHPDAQGHMVSDGRSDTADHLQTEPHAVFQGSAVLIGALVGHR